MQKERDLHLDLIRGLAGLLVLSVHFFLNNGYYTTPMFGRKMLVMTVVRMGFMVCVPLFLLLTGYLCRKRTLSKRYYLGVVRILITYGLCTLVCLLFRQFVFHQQLDVGTSIKMLLNYSGAPYSWYIEMYLGLFLIIPFLNILYNGLGGQGQKQVLIITLFVMSSLPTVINQTDKILPSWWLNLYPVLYYMMGAYLAEYRPKLRWRWGIPLLFTMVLVGGIRAYRVCDGATFRWRDENDWMGTTIVISTVVVFLLLQNTPLDTLPKWCKGLITRASELSLGIYLVSWCYDSLFYPILAERVPQMVDRMFYFFAIVPAVYLCSFVTAQAVEWGRVGLTWGINRLFPALKLK